MDRQPTSTQNKRPAAGGSSLYPHGLGGPPHYPAGFYGGVETLTPRDDTHAGLLRRLRSLVSQRRSRNTNHTTTTTL
jgi:hypothetical protein